MTLLLPTVPAFLIHPVGGDRVGVEIGWGGGGDRVQEIKLNVTFFNLNN